MDQRNSDSGTEMEEQWNNNVEEQWNNDGGTVEQIWWSSGTMMVEQWNSRRMMGNNRAEVVEQ